MKKMAVEKYDCQIYWTKDQREAIHSRNAVKWKVKIEATEISESCRSQDTQKCRVLNTAWELTPPTIRKEAADFGGCHV